MKTEEEIAIALQAIAECVAELGQFGKDRPGNITDEAKTSIAQVMQVAGVLAWVLNDHDCPSFGATDRLLRGLIEAGDIYT